MHELHCMSRFTPYGDNAGAHVCSVIVRLVTDGVVLSASSQVQSGPSRSSVCDLQHAEMKSLGCVFMLSVLSGFVAEGPLD